MNPKYIHIRVRILKHNGCLKVLNLYIYSVTGLGWFDEKVDLSVLNNPDSLLDHQNETQALMEDDSAYLLGLLGDSFDPSYLTSDLFKNVDIDFTKEFDVQSLINEPASSEVLDSHLASPQCTTLQVHSPASYPVQSPASPYSDISDASEESSSIILNSPESSSLTSDFSNNDLQSSVIQVLVCDTVTSPTCSEPALSIEEVSESVRKRKFVTDGGSRPKIVKVMFPDDIPAVRTRAPKLKDRREKKKVQNKEAAARYRIKKRMEEKILSVEVEKLESTQKELQEKSDQLQMEIKYLKSLMCEMLTKKGIMK